MLLFRRRGATSPSIKLRGTITDTEFGDVMYRRSHTSRYVKLRLLPDGSLSASLPYRAPVRMITELIDNSRDELREHIRNQTPRPTYGDGQMIGKSHKLVIIASPRPTPTHSFSHQSLVVKLPESWSITSSTAQNYLRDVCARALRKEAEAYLPRRLRHLAQQYGFSYVKVRYGNPKGRWGSYSSNGTISLNVALMNLPLEVIDYVLIHELCHSRHQHHQPSFWAEVAKYLPDYKELRRTLKSYSPYL